MTHAWANGLGALVVEDEALVAMFLEDALNYLGFAVRIASKLDDANDAARDGSFAFAILDTNVRGKKVYPVADTLMARGIPFILSSGDRGYDLPANLRSCPNLPKPFTMRELTDAIRKLLV